MIEISPSEVPSFVIFEVFSKYDTVGMTRMSKDSSGARFLQPPIIEISLYSDATLQRQICS